KLHDGHEGVGDLVLNGLRPHILQDCLLGLRNDLLSLAVEEFGMPKRRGKNEELGRNTRVNLFSLMWPFLPSCLDDRTR
ncbi:hypothetical protein A2U01_0071428, partial [Trifolium medium]|nr:hypothetical protein [Trifolium medium]